MARVPSSFFGIIFLAIGLVSNLSGAVPGDPDLIRRTCNSTSFFDLCVSSLQSDPKSSKSDVKGLSVIVINLGIANATDTSLYTSHLVTRRRNAALNSALEGCADRYTDARAALCSALEALSLDDYDFASLHVSAAAAYADMCHSLFRLSPALTYPAALSSREKALERLCTIASDIISLLG